MNMSFKPSTAINRLALSIATIAATQATTAFAAESKLSLEEVVVTARHQSESLQSTPVAISNARIFLPSLESALDGLWGYGSDFCQLGDRQGGSGDSTGGVP